MNTHENQTSPQYFFQLLYFDFQTLSLDDNWFITVWDQTRDKYWSFYCAKRQDMTKKPEIMYYVHWVNFNLLHYWYCPSIEEKGIILRRKKIFRIGLSHRPISQEWRSAFPPIFPTAEKIDKTRGKRRRKNNKVFLSSFCAQFVSRKKVKKRSKTREYFRRRRNSTQIGDSRTCELFLY